jgi:DNA-binding LacI/PurR family transcriptional regulator
VIGDAEGPTGPKYPNYLTGYQGVQRLLQLRARPTAIVARNDVTAVGALQALNETGLRVPGDISVTGFDNIPLAATISPALTTMTRPTEEEGRLAGEFLIARLERPQESIVPRTILFERHLITRASTAFLVPARPERRRRHAGLTTAAKPEVD